VSISTKDSSLFISGSCVSTAELWDMRTPARALHTFQGQGGDVNTVQFLPDGHHFGTGSDGVYCFFDTRMGHELQHATSRGHSNVTSTAFSNSGCLLFVGYTNANCYVWDTFWWRYACYHFNMLEDLTLFFLVVLITLS
jgi:guanine nucleotide-binding protein G(I)/G(S)/G(T) subunit beta-1